MRISGQEAAGRFIDRFYPDCLLAVLGGSSGSKKETDFSDLDIVIVDDSAQGPYRATSKADDWIIECFVLTSSSYRDLFDEGIHAANPSLQRMLHEGIPIKCSEAGQGVIQEARSDLLYGPMPWSPSERDAQRYFISDFLEDIKAGGSFAESWFIVSRLVTALCEFKLRANQQWIAEGKHLFREVKKFDPPFANKLEASLQAFCLEANCEGLTNLILETLEPYGGLLLEGFEG